MAKKAKQAWIRTKNGLIVSGVAGILLAYAFLTRALDTGSYWQYAGGVIFLLAGLKMLIRARKK